MAKLPNCRNRYIFQYNGHFIGHIFEVFVFLFDKLRVMKQRELVSSYSVSNFVLHGGGYGGGGGGA
jgi:hypothetical protein